MMSDTISFAPESTWQGQFRFAHIKCLIVCRGPIRLEAIECFESLGAQCGILLSEKDSILYPQTLAPELRRLKNRQAQVHHVPDYMGASREERLARMDEIVRIGTANGYTHLFAGYGFMAEDAEFVQRVEDAGLVFVGPNSSVIRQAGAKDEAKQLARKLEVSVTPGEDRISARTLLRKAGNAPQVHLQQSAQQHGLEFPEQWLSTEPLEQAEAVLQAAYRKRVDLFSTEDLIQETERCAVEIWAGNPGRRIRLKHIGGGGGKGQRVVSNPEEVRDAVMGVLLEAKATGVGDNKNFLVELNIENTRHNEVQLLGNGIWCVELGGRDCSLQMHEQKLLEVSLTEELLEAAITEYEAAGNTKKAAVLRADLATLRTICGQAVDFGEALRLDSASTFECIIEGDRHYFMEVNTRIQVEHRVTEMAYSLRFTNPDDPEDSFLCESLVAAMLLIACHGAKLPKPARIPRYTSGVEARINATNPALKPHAGGILRHWSSPTTSEHRDDQGIGLRNPDTGLFQPYHLAGAYDSNVSLSVTHGSSRRESFERLVEILRTMEVRGSDLHLNLDFHYGLLHWMLGHDPMVKPNTRFVQAYLALAGKLQQQANELSLATAWQHNLQQIQEQWGPNGVALCEQKQTLLLRPLKRLFGNAHLLMGWLAPRPQRRWLVEIEFQWWRNPVEVLADLYHYLRLEEHPDTPPSEQIWPDDQALLQRGLDFYRDLRTRLGQPDLDWFTLTELLKQDSAPGSFVLAGEGQALWGAVRAAHHGFQLGMELTRLPALLGHETGYDDFLSNDQLDVNVPEEFLDAELSAGYVTTLAPPPPANSDEVLAWTGGTFYARETPESKSYVQAGDHVEIGDTLGLLEVMKMFNPIRAEFAGTIRTLCVKGNAGVIVTRGQQLFEITPDTPPSAESEEQRTQRQHEATLRLLAA
jgi:acetyl/propionyl-CoA carboxylase alpha subunit